MMRTRTLLAVLALAVAGCAGLGRRGTGPAPLTGVVLFGSGTSVTAVDAATGSTLFTRTGVPALGDRSTLFATSAEGPGASLEAYDSGSGELLSSVRVPEGFGVRVAANDGSRVALVRGAPEPGDWTPHPRATTEILVADPSGATRARRYVLDGNFDPEAFSLDGRQLLLLEYVPPTAPEAYRVVRLDLDRGVVFPVLLSHVKRIAETMSGTRLEQLASPDGRFLFTLYTSQPPAYSGDGSKVSEPVAFVHALDLRNATAHCIALPEELWGGDPRVEAMALSPNGAFLHVVDTERAILAEIATRSGEVTRTTDVDFGAASGEAHAVMTDASTLVVGTGSELVTVDTTTLHVVERRSSAGEIGGLGRGDDGLFVATPEGVEVIEPTTGEAVEHLPSPAIPDLDYIGSLEP